VIRDTGMRGETRPSKGGEEAISAAHILDIRGNIPREHLNTLFSAKRGSTTTYTDLNIVSPPQTAWKPLNLSGMQTLIRVATPLGRFET